MQQLIELSEVFVFVLEISLFNLVCTHKLKFSGNKNLCLLKLNLLYFFWDLNQAVDVAAVMTILLQALPPMKSSNRESMPSH